MLICQNAEGAHDQVWNPWASWVQLVEYAPPKLVDWVRFAAGSHWKTVFASC